LEAWHVGVNLPPLAQNTLRGLTCQRGLGMAAWQFLPGTSYTSSILETGVWGGLLTLPYQACLMSAEDSMTHLLAKPYSEAGQVQTTHGWP
jgi:hypothetical protein